MIGLDIGALLGVIVVGALVLALPVALIWVVFKLLQGLFWVLGKVFGGIGRGIGAGARGTGALVARTFRFGRDEIGDSLRLVGGLVTSFVYVPLVLLNVCLGRWSTANHFGRELEGELRRSSLALYRFSIGNPARFLGFGAVTEGIERRLPEALARAPRGDRRGGLREFDGYRVIDTLPRGGSGAWLFLAEASSEKLQQFARAGHPRHERVVLKSFSLDEGSTLPQIVRESRALESARDLGLVLDHELTAERFFYAMPYVEGDDLGVVTRRLHDRSGEAGLDLTGLREAIAAAGEVLETLDRFHAKGLWHKDIKPSNVIVGASGGARRAHLVDLGLVTPLGSAMTLTTHGTEYFRDPEMVRLAMRGVKVQDVDGVKFDLYSVGALLYSMLENSFPAHGSLSQVTKRCPDTLRWVVRRAMADMSQRYGSAREMLTDLRVLLAAPDPFALRPADLPSLGGEPVGAQEVELANLHGFDADRPGPGQPLAPSFGVPGSDPELDEAAAISAAKARKRRSKVGVGVLVAALVLFFLVVVPIGALVVGVAAYASADAGSGMVYTLDGDSAGWNSGRWDSGRWDSGGWGHDSPESSVDVRVHSAPGSPLGVRALPPTVPPAAPFSRTTPDDYPVSQLFWNPEEFEDVAGRLAEVLSTGSGEWMDWLERQARLLDAPTGRGGPVGRVIVLDDLRPGSGGDKVAALLEALRAARFEVLTESGALDEESIDLLAGVRAAVGLADPQSADAARALREYLLDQDLSDHVLWLDDHPDGLGVEYRFVAPGVDTGARVLPVN